MKIKVGGIVCIWCGETVWHATASQRQKALDAMKAHDMNCKSHPAVIALNAWHQMFGTTQLTHAVAAKESLEAEVARLTKLLNAAQAEAKGD